MSKRIWFIILFSLFALLDLYLLYLTIGYLVLGTQAPLLYNGEYTYFMGMYIMSITYGCAFIVLTTILIVLLILFIKKNKKIKKLNKN